MIHEYQPYLQVMFLKFKTYGFDLPDLLECPKTQTLPDTCQKIPMKQCQAAASAVDKFGAWELLKQCEYLKEVLWIVPNIENIMLFF